MTILLFTENNLIDHNNKLRDVFERSKERLIKRKFKIKENYDRDEIFEDIQVNYQILLKDYTQKNKLNPLWTGPYEVTDILDKENIIIWRGRRCVTLHKNNVKKFFENPGGGLE